jgi:adenine C2-methylase RlmN of 23S rRNA A2503 and tRNA A37
VSSADVEIVSARASFVRKVVFVTTVGCCATTPKICLTGNARQARGSSASEFIRRIIEIATIDALGLENSIARARVLIALRRPRPASSRS